MRGQGIRIRRALRRAVALFLTTLALWLLGLVCDLGAAAQRLGESPRFVAAALQAELGPVKGGEGAWESRAAWNRAPSSSPPPAAGPSRDRGRDMASPHDTKKSPDHSGLSRKIT